MKGFFLLFLSLFCSLSFNSYFFLIFFITAFTALNVPLYNLLDVLLSIFRPVTRQQHNNNGEYARNLIKNRSIGIHKLMIFPIPTHTKIWDKWIINCFIPQLNGPNLQQSFTIDIFDLNVLMGQFEYLLK